MGKKISQIGSSRPEEKPKDVMTMTEVGMGYTSVFTPDRQS